jgi:hypothetical protein
MSLPNALQRRPSAHACTAAAPLKLADGDDEVHILHVPPQSALVFECDNDDEVIYPRPMLSCPSSTSRLLVRPRAAPQACGRGRCPLGYG